VTPATLVIGCGIRLIEGLQGQVPDGSVLVIEHPELIDKRGLHEKVAKFPAVAGLIAGEYIYGCDPRALVALLPPGSDIRRVIPSTDEISVIASAVVATELGLPGVGVHAAEIFADKLRLRAAAETAGLANPRWSEIRDLPDLEAKVRELDADGFVLKPSGRSGSLGVLLLNRGDDLAQAWQQTTTAEGRVRLDRPTPTRYLVEERLYGPEVSVECLAYEGEVVFTNITRKHVQPGRHPVEIGHVLPAQLDPGVERELTTSMRTLVKATDYGSGILHGEWIITPTGPVLVECAARIPGDRITDLLTLAYGVPFIAAYADLLTGPPGRTSGLVAPPGAAGQVAAITFLTPRPGTVERIDGVEAARDAAGVQALGVDVAIGGEVALLRASRDRVGWLKTVGADATQAWARAAHAAGLITVTTR
jgi:biotin carboxylase